MKPLFKGVAFAQTWKTNPSPSLNFTKSFHWTALQWKEMVYVRQDTETLKDSVLDRSYLLWSHENKTK